MSEPLDLHALEVRLKFGDSLDAAECGALLTTLLAHRAALQRCREVLDLFVANRTAWENGTVGAREHAAAVLASCTDQAGAAASEVPQE